MSRAPGSGMSPEEIETKKRIEFKQAFKRAAIMVMKRTKAEEDIMDDDSAN